MDESRKNRFLNISKLTKENVGSSEENVKQKIVVPLLESLGHHRNDLDFEYASRGKRIDIFIKDLPADCKVIIDTKAFSENLEDHIEQIEEYAFRENPLFTLIINGEEIRIYSLIRGLSFADSLLYAIRISDLANEEEAITLEKCIARENLISRKTRTFVQEREEEILNLRMRIEHIEGQYEQQQKEIEEQIRNNEQRRKEIDIEIDKLSKKLECIIPEKQKEIEQLYLEVKLPFIDSVNVIDEPEVREELTFSQSYLVTDRNAVEIVLPPSRKLNTIPRWRKYELIPVSSKIRSFFPGYKIAFSLETDKGEIITHMTSASAEDVEVGDKKAGWYFSAQMRRWYRSHKELKTGDILIITKLNDRKYKLEIKR